MTRPLYCHLCQSPGVAFLGARVILSQAAPSAEAEKGEVDSWRLMTAIPMAEMTEPFLEGTGHGSYPPQTFVQEEEVL